MKKATQIINRHRIVMALLLVTLTASSLLIWRRIDTDSSIIKTDDEGGIINMNPPTKQEKQAGNVRKQEIDKEEALINQQEKIEKKNVNVIITDAGQYAEDVEVRAFIPDHYQDGTCTILFQKDSLSISKSSPAYRDISTTICTNPKIKRSEFSSSGEWKVTVSYESKDSKGASDPQSIIIE